MTALSPAVGTWQIDPSHSTVGFSVRHAMVATVRGAFTEFSGTITAPDDSSAVVDVTIQAASVDTGNHDRDEHVRSADFFNVAENPTWTFHANQVQAIDGEEFELVGTLTANGVAKEVTLAAEFLGTATDPFGQERAGFSATTTILRTDFGLTWNAALETGGVLVSDKVRITLDISAIRA